MTNACSVELIDVDENWTPPQQESAWALVRVALSGASQVNGVNIETAVSAIFQSANNPPDIVNAIDDARDWARSHGLRSVHVRRARAREEDEAPLS